MKTKGNTPKYGLIYHSTFIGRADSKNKGRISRYLANKCAIATRIDSFSETPSRLYGDKLRDQVEERLKFYETGQAPRKNIDVMAEVARELKAGKVDNQDDDDAMDVDSTPKAVSKTKKDKSSSKKRKTEGDDSATQDKKRKSGEKTPQGEGDDNDDEEDGGDVVKSDKKSKKDKKKKKKKTKE